MVYHSIKKNYQQELMLYISIYLFNIIEIIKIKNIQRNLQ